MGRQPRVARQDRKGGKGWANGIRESILKPHISRLCVALQSTQAEAARECLSSIQHQYHAQVHWTLEDHEEPLLPLTPYDETESVGPEIEVLTPDEELRKVKRIAELNLVSSVLL